jgi:hypothetical protein
VKIEYKKIFLVLFLAWIIIWVNFIIRDMTKGKHFAEYRVLLTRDAAGKASYTYGDRLFEFLKFCDKSLPGHEAYDMAGVEYLSLDFRRIIYYLYPRIKEDGAPYILVFDKPGYTKDGYVVFRELDPSRFILKRI